MVPAGVLAAASLGFFGLCVACNSKNRRSHGRRPTSKEVFDRFSKIFK
tara:strand:- start:192 stop:335 length:144 start_codon:yes stop_codon:yes gene_type:complete